MADQAATVTIILPTYNRGSLLGKCVASVQEQTYKAWRLLICDDASDDATGEIAARCVTADKRTFYLRNAHHLGLPATRNVGVRAATTELVMFIEDDIVLEPGCLQHLVDGFREMTKLEKVGAVAPCRCEPHPGRDATVLDFAWRLGSRRVGVPCSLSPLTGLIRYNFAPRFHGFHEVPSVHPCSLYSKSAILAVGAFDAHTFRGNFLYEEADLNLRLRRAGYRLYFQPSAVLHHMVVRQGGCRVNVQRYACYFLVNHCKFVVKNFGIRAVWMIPAFLMASAATAVSAFTRFAAHSIRRALSGETA